MSHYDVVVIGGGAAGLSAALVLSRARRHVAVVDAGEPRNAPADHMHGYLSRDGMAPSELLQVGRAEVQAYGGQLLSGRVQQVQRCPEGFEVQVSDGEPMTTRHVVVTTGLRDVLPDIPGLAERWGRDLLHCPYCHGYEVRDRPLGVLGGSAEAVQHAQLVRQWSHDVVLFPHTDALAPAAREPLEARGIGVAGGRVTRLVVTGDELTGVELEGHQVIARAAVFVRPRFVPNDTLLTSLGCAVDEQGWVITDADGRTSQPAVWAAGNATNPRAQVITAAGEGSATALAVNAALVDDDARIASINRGGGAITRGTAPA